MRFFFSSPFPLSCLLLGYLEHFLSMPLNFSIVILTVSVLYNILTALPTTFHATVVLHITLTLKLPPEQCCNFCFYCPTYLKEPERRTSLLLLFLNPRVPSFLLGTLVFLVVKYGCESWTVRKAECQRTDAFELWCWGRLLRVLGLQADQTNQS